MYVDYLTFTVGQLYFGIPSAGVLEINKNLEVTPVPGSAKFVKGLINLRGQLVPAMNMHQYLGVEQSELISQPISIILSVAGKLVSLQVDTVGDILPLHESTFESVPSNLSETSSKLILGGHKLSGKLLLVFDYKQIFPSEAQVNQANQLNQPNQPLIAG